MLKQKTRAFLFITALLAVVVMAGNGNVVEASQSDSKTVTLIYSGAVKSVSTKVSTVGDLLTEMNILIDDNDKISHPVNTKIHGNMTIVIKQVDIKEVTKVEAIPFETIHIASEAAGGQILQAGQLGEKKVTYKVTYIDGKEIKSVALNSLITKQAIPCKVSCGPKVAVSTPVQSRGKTTSRGQSIRNTKKTITMVSTAYAAESFRHSKTATGTRAVRGVVAVDPKVIPLGTKLYVEGYGYAVAADTGGAIKGNRIDLVMNTVKECRKWGRKKVQVHILN